MRVRIDKAIAPAAPDVAHAIFNVRPTRGDPLFGLLKDRWNLSPIQVTGLFLLFYLVVGFLLSLASGTAFPMPGLRNSFTTDPARLLFSGFLLPCAAFLAARFYAQTEVTFERLFTERVILADADAYDAFLRRLDARFNSPALHISVAAAAIAFRLVDAYHASRDSVNEWIDLSNGVGAWYHLAINLVSWYLGFLLVCKAFIAARAMRRVFDWPVNLQPFHPDGCGGLRLLTDISITIALCVGLAGPGVVIFLWLGEAAPLSPQVLVASGLIFLTPIVFMSCIYGAHCAMLHARDSLLRNVNEQVQPSYQLLCQQLAGGSLPEEATESILRMEALHAVIRRMPVWPVNTAALAQVFLSAAVPVVVLAVQAVIERFAK